MASAKCSNGGEHCLGCNKFFRMRLAQHLRASAECRKSYDQPSDKRPAMPETSESRRSATELFQCDMREQVTLEMSALRFAGNPVPGSVVDHVKYCVGNWCNTACCELVRTLQPHISPQSGIDLVELLQSRLTWFKDVETQHRELQEFKSIHKGLWVSPQKRKLGEHDECIRDGASTVKTKTVEDFCVDFPLAAQLQALIVNDPSAWYQIRQASASWSTEEERPRPEVLTDIPHGDIFSEHPKLGLKSGPLSDAGGAPAFKFALKGYFDEIEVANPLGYARGIHLTPTQTQTQTLIPTLILPRAHNPNPNCEPSRLCTRCSLDRMLLREPHQPRAPHSRSPRVHLPGDAGAEHRPQTLRSA